MFKKFAYMIDGDEVEIYTRSKVVLVNGVEATKAQRIAINDWAFFESLKYAEIRRPSKFEAKVRRQLEFVAEKV